MKVKTITITCNQCGHSWTPRGSEVRLCPKCKKVTFNDPKK